MQEMQEIKMKTTDYSNFIQQDLGNGYYNAKYGKIDAIMREVFIKDYFGIDQKHYYFNATKLSRQRGKEIRNFLTIESNMKQLDLIKKHILESYFHPPGNRQSEIQDQQHFGISFEMVINDPEKDTRNAKFGTYIHIKALVLIAQYIMPEFIIEAQNIMDKVYEDQAKKHINYLIHNLNNEIGQKNQILQQLTEFRQRFNQEIELKNQQHTQLTTQIQQLLQQNQEQAFLIGQGNEEHKQTQKLLKKSLKNEQKLIKKQKKMMKKQEEFKEILLKFGKKSYKSNIKNNDAENQPNQLEQREILTKCQKGGIMIQRIKIQKKIGEKKIGDKVVNVFAQPSPNDEEINIISKICDGSENKQGAHLQFLRKRCQNNKGTQQQFESDDNHFSIPFTFSDPIKKFYKQTIDSWDFLKNRGYICISDDNRVKLKKRYREMNFDKFVDLLCKDYEQYNSQYKKQEWNYVICALDDDNYYITQYDREIEDDYQTKSQMISLLLDEELDYEDYVFSTTKNILEFGETLKNSYFPNIEINELYIKMNQSEYKIFEKKMLDVRLPIEYFEEIEE